MLETRISNTRVNTIAFSGPLIEEHIEIIRKYINLYKSGSMLVIDLERAEYIGADFMHALLDLKKEKPEACSSITFTNAAGYVLSCMCMLHLDKIFNIN
jgi:hypothetical protein